MPLRTVLGPLGVMQGHLESSMAILGQFYAILGQLDIPVAILGQLDTPVGL